VTYYVITIIIDGFFTHSRLLHHISFADSSSRRPLDGTESFSLALADLSV
jgi:hypothetical protein